MTESGDLVELEESVSADQVPAAVRAEAGSGAPLGATLTFEKKTTVFYEVHFQAGGQELEQLFTPDGRVVHE